MRKKIFVRGPVLTQSGYGEQARFALRSLRSQPDLFDVYIQLQHGDKQDGSGKIVSFVDGLTKGSK